MARIKFMTDSAADIPAPLREEFHIQVLPFPIAMGEREYADGFDFTPQEFYAQLLAAPQIPTHAQLNPYVFSQSFEQAWQEGYTDLIHTSINSKGSSTYQNAIQARRDFYEEHPACKDTFHIHIIDSHNYTMSYGYLVLEGAKMAATGVGAGEIVDYIQGQLPRARVIFSPLDLHFAKKSGRVSAAAAFVGEALGLKPIMTFEDGVSKILSKVRGEKHVVSSLVERCKQERRLGSPYMLVTADNLEQGDKLRQACLQELGEAPTLEYSVGGVIAINAGPNLIGLVYYT